MNKFLVILVGLGISNPARSQQTQAPAQLVSEFNTAKVFWQQFEIAQKLVAVGDRTVLHGMESWLTHDDRHQRGNAAFIFASLGDDRGFQVIGSILNDRSDRLVGQGIPGGGWSFQRQISADRYYAVHLFGKLKDARALAILVPLLESERSISNLSWALREIGENATIHSLIDALHDTNPNVRVLAIQSLQKRWVYEARPALVGLLGDADKSNFGGLEVTVAAAAQIALKKLDAVR